MFFISFMTNWVTNFTWLPLRGVCKEVMVLATYLWLSIIFQGGQGWIDWPPFYFKAQLQKTEICEEKNQTCFGEEAATFWHWTLLLPFRLSPPCAVSIWMRFMGISALLTYQNIYLVHFSATSLILLSSQSQ